MILAQLSDPHVSVRDWAAADGLALAVRAVLGLRPLPDAVLVSGDIANGADGREYARAHELLALLPVPVHVLAGNHDDRDALRARFGAGEFDVRCGGIRLLGCDTSIPGRDDGALGAETLARLEAQLAAGAGVPTIVAMHHPPIEIGMPAFDDIGLPAADRRALAELLAGHPQVQRVVAGHVHRTVLGTLGGCPVLTCPSTWLAARLEIGGRDLELVPEPPGILVHALVGGALTSHLQPVG